MNVFVGKKLLILGGAFQHCKLVREAKKHGVFTIVTDNLLPENSPAKNLADEYWMLNIYDVDSIVERCRAERVDGIISGWLDPCQRPYAEICHRLGKPAYCIPAQVVKMTDKAAFKEMCREYNVDVIPDYSLDDVKNKRIEFPVFVKPVDSRGSRGQTVCHSYDELEGAISFARKESSNGAIIIEKYMEGLNEFHVTYFFINGEPHLVRCSDNYCGPVYLKMDKVVSCAIYPSRFMNQYLNSAHENVVNMFKHLGIEYGPVFMQGFKDGNKFRFFDPGLRFPGVDCESVIEKATGANFMEAMIQFALTGKCNVKNIENASELDGKIAAVLYLNVRPGIITNIKNNEHIASDSSVIAFLQRCKVGDKVSWSYNVNQRFAEVDILAASLDELKDSINRIQREIVVEDEEHKNMIFNTFDVSRIEQKGGELLP